MSGEVWRSVPMNSSFLVSSEGRVMVAPYLSPVPNGGLRHYGGIPHFGVWNKENQRFITVLKGRTYKIHRLVCLAFHGFPPNGKPNCLHIDENPANNRASNLKWGSQKENLNAPGFLEYREYCVGDFSPTAKSIAGKASRIAAKENSL